MPISTINVIQMIAEKKPMTNSTNKYMVHLATCDHYSAMGTLNNRGVKVVLRTRTRIRPTSGAQII